MRRMQRWTALLLCLLLLTGLAACGEQTEPVKETEAFPTEAPIQWHAETLSYVVGELYDVCPRGNGYYLAADSGIYELDAQFNLTGELLSDGAVLVAMQNDRLLYLGYDEAGDYAILDEAGGAAPIELGHEAISAQLLPLGETLWFCDGFKLLRDDRELTLPQEPGALWHAAALVETGDELSVVLTRTATDTLKPTGAWLVPVDDSTEALSEKDGTELPVPLWTAATYCNPASRCVCADGVLWRLENGTFSKFVELSSFGVNPSRLRRALITEDRVLCLEEERLTVLSESSNDISTTGSTERDDPSETSVVPAVPRTLTVGALWNQDYLCSEWIAYVNRTKPGCKLTCRVYETVEKLNLAILNHEVDLLALNDVSVLQNYGNQDLLYPVEELCPELQSADALYQNMIDALRYKGDCLYLPLAMSPTVNILPKRYGFSPGEAASLAALGAGLEEVDPDTFSQSTKDCVLETQMLPQTLSNWIDPETGQLSFDSPDFIELLEFCDRYALTWEEVGAAGSGLTPEDNARHFTMGIPLQLSWYGLLTHNDLYALPDSGDVRLNLSSQVYLAVLNHTDRTTAEKLVNSLLFDEGWFSQLSRSQAAFQIYLNREWTEVGFKNETDRLDQLEQTYLESGFTDVPSLTAERNLIQSYRELFQEKVCFLAPASDLIRVVLEEAQPYFQGEITAQEAARRIQNRVEIYLAERG